MNSLALLGLNECSKASNLENGRKMVRVLLLLLMIMMMMMSLILPTEHIALQ